MLNSIGMKWLGAALGLAIASAGIAAPAEAISLEEAFHAAEAGNPTYLRAGLALEQAELALAKLQADRTVQSAALPIRQAQGARAAALVGKDAARRKLRLEVRKAYYTLLASVKQLEVAGEAKGQASDQLRVIQGRLAQGATVRLDVLNAEKALAEAETGQLRAETAVRLAQLSLGDLIGLSADNLPQPDGAPVEARRELPDDGPAIDLTLSRSPELRQAEEALAAAELARDLTENDYTPELVKRTAATRVTDGRLAVEEVRRRLALQVRRALADARLAQAGLGFARKTVGAASEAYRAARVRFEAGLWVSDELLTAQVKLFQAKQAELQASLDLDLARAAVFSLIGD